MNINDLASKIEKWSQSYYDGKPEVSDSVFDFYFNKFKELDPSHELISKVSSGYVTNYSPLEKKKHEFFCGSLGKIKKGGAGEWANKDYLVCTPKMDGGSVVVYYKEGKLEKVLSRGDGEIGLDITYNLLNSNSFPLEVPVLGSFAARGELVLSYEDAAELEASHPRNKAIGLSQSIYSDSNDLCKLKIIFYDAPITTNLDYVSRLNLLSEYGFSVVDYKIFDSLHKVEEEYTDQSKTRIAFRGMTYPIDGLVFVDSNSESIAYKFENATVETTVEEIQWSLSKTGRYVPVLIVDPVNVSGATISRVTANNYEWLLSWKAGVGSRILITRSNEIIPMLVDVIDGSTEYNHPVNCEVCDDPLTHEGVDLKCLNDKCPAKEDQAIFNLLETYKSTGLGWVTICNVIDKFSLTSFGAVKLWINTVSQEDLSQYFGPATTELLFTLVTTLRTHPTTFVDVLYSSSIPTIGWATIDNIRNNVSLNQFIDTVKNLNVNAFDEDPWAKCYPSYKQHMYLKRYVQRLYDICEVFDWKIHDVSRTNYLPPVTLRYSLTGSLSKSRDEIITEFRSYGFEFTSVEKADVFIANKESSSSKYTKAKSQSLPILSEKEFRETYVCI